MRRYKLGLCLVFILTIVNIEHHPALNFDFGAGEYILCIKLLGLQMRDYVLS